MCGGKGYGEKEGGLSSLSGKREWVQEQFRGREVESGEYEKREGGEKRGEEVIF